MPEVLPRLKVFGVLFAWLLVAGAQWDVLQAVAWSRMFVGYAQQMSMKAAVRQTFSGEMCGMCETVQKGKAEQERSPGQAPQQGKIRVLEIVLNSASTLVVPPQRSELGMVPACPAIVGYGRTPPPLPPPRAQV